MSTPSNKVFTKRVHIFKAGPQISAQGVEREFTPEDLQQVVDSYDPKTHEAPLVIGHSGDNDSAPSFGWVKKFVRKGEDLYADVDFTDAAKDLVKDGHYRKVSVSFYSPESPVNPHQGHWSARHLALLGAAPPSVKGLEAFSFSEKGVYDFATTSSIGEIFDEELGPTLLIERSPLEILKEKLQEVRGDMDNSLKELEENQENQSQATADETSQQSADEKTAPENPAQQFSEMKKKLGREGAEASDSAQSIADLETEFPEEKFEEGVSRRVRKGANGQKVQVVEQVFEEDDEMSEDHKEIPEAFKKNIEKMKAKAKGGHKAEAEMEDADHGELPPALRKNMEKMKAKKKMHAEEEDESDGEFAEVSHKTVSNHKPSFGKHAQKDEEDPAGRGKTGRSTSDSYANRQAVGESGEEDRDTIAKNGEEDLDRVRTAKSAEEDADRLNTGKDSEGDDDSDGRWADQPEGKSRAHNMDQYDDGEEGLPQRNKPGVSDGDEPRGRDGGPTSFTRKVEEDPDSEDITVQLESTKGNKVSRVLHTASGEKRAPLKGGSISDHSEESDGVTRKAKEAAISSGSEPRGRDDGPTEFPVRSEEDPDDMELAVDVESIVDNPKVRVLRQKSGDKASVDHSEEDILTDDDIDGLIESILQEVSEEDFGEKMPYTKTGLGSTYGSRKAKLKSEEMDEDEYEDEEDEEEDEDEEFAETESFCGTGSMGQSRSKVYPVMFDEFRKQLHSLKKENEKLRKEYKEHKVRSRKEKIAEQVNQLYTEGKITDGIIPQRELQNYCEGLEFGTLEFSEGETPASKLLQLLDRLPNMVYFGEVVQDGVFQEDDFDLDPHTKALRMVESGECSDYVEAIKRCIDWGY